MKRRDFLLAVGGGAGLLALPSWALALPPAVKVKRFIVRHSGSDTQYPAELIEIGNRFWYRAMGVTISIPPDEARHVSMCHWLFYFSAALKLHFRIERIKEGRPLPGDLP